MRTKEHSQQSNTNKNIFIYQQVHWKKIITNVQNIVRQIFVCVCVCVSGYYLGVCK